MIVLRLVMLSPVAAMVTPKLWAQVLIPMNVPPQPEMLAESIRTGKVEVTPNSGVAGEYGAWTVAYQAGGTIKSGGGIRVQLPEAWHAGQRNSANRLQATAPGEPNRTGQADVPASVTIEEGHGHHTLKMPDPIDWSTAHNPEFRRNFEIYSGQGLSEEYDPTHPLAFEQSLFTNPSTTTKTGMSAQRAWIEGYELSTIASSDDHRAHPGQPEYGLAAVRAGSLTREGVFDALYHRRTYGTTGLRIILDFDINQVPMGGKLSATGPVSIRLRAVGTDVIDSVQVLRHRKGHPGFEIIRDESPAPEQVVLSFTDGGFTDDAVYYARVRQRHRVRQCIAMAWSSPIRVRFP